MISYKSVAMLNRYQTHSKYFCIDRAYSYQNSSTMMSKILYFEVYLVKTVKDESQQCVQVRRPTKISFYFFIAVGASLTFYIQLFLLLFLCILAISQDLVFLVLSIFYSFPKCYGGNFPNDFNIWSPVAIYQLMPILLFPTWPHCYSVWKFGYE